MRFLKNIETVSFKKRYNIGYKLPKLIFGEFSLTLCKSYNVEYIYLYNFKKSLKNFFKFKKSKSKKIWLFLHKNYPLTKKSKNSRMGKGKGTIVRYCSRISQNHNLFEFIGFSLREILKLQYIFKKKVNMPTNVGSNFFLNKGYNHIKGHESNFFFKKYKS